VAISVSNLCFLRVWSEAPPYLHSNVEFFLKSPHGPSHYAALLGNIMVVAAAVWVALRFLRRSKTRWARIAQGLGFLVLCSVVLNSIRLVVAASVAKLATWTNWQRHMGRPVAATLLCAGWLALLLLLWKKRLLLYRVGAIGAVVLSPLALLNSGEAAVMCLRRDRGAWTPTDAYRRTGVTARESGRVVVLLFDEWDYRLSFEKRDGGLQLPEFDRFRSEAVEATRAYPPARGTLLALPSITTGVRMAGVEVTGPGKIAITPTGALSSSDWGRSDNMFRLAREKGLNVAIVGWYFPYCRIFAESLGACWWWPASFAGFPQDPSVAATSWNQLRTLIETRRLSPFGQPLEVDAAVRTHIEQIGRLRATTADPQFDVVFAHLPTTHAPYFYNRESGEFDRKWSPRTSYFDGLALGDRVLGEIRRGMEDSDTWMRSTVILTSDHSYRDSDLLDGRSDSRVPLLVRMAGGSKQVKVDSVLSTMNLKDLVLALAAGELRTMKDTAAWLRTRAGKGIEAGDLPGHHGRE
jgi:hypothetical protein